MNADSVVYNFRAEDGVRVEERLQLPHLQELLYWFQNHRPPAEPPANPGPPSDYPFYTPSTVQKRTPGLLSPQEFKDTLVKVLGRNDFEEQFDSLFTKLDTSCDGYVDWNEFCTYMLLQFRENDYMRTKKHVPFQTEPRIRHSVHNRQETTSKVLSVDGPTKYITVSKEGAIVVWDTNLHVERQYALTEGEEEGRGGGRRRVREWVTDAVYMPNCHKLAIASTGRDLRFFDTTSSQYFQEYYLYGLPNVATCLCYHYEEQVQGGVGSGMLLCGDDHGSIKIFYFHKPTMQMFATPFKKEEGAARVYFPDFGAHSKWVEQLTLEGIHPEPVRKILYMPDNDCVMTSSASSTSSLVIMDIQRKKKTYIFKISKGVECFDYNKALNLLVTGGGDHLVRLWNPYVVSKPVAVLVGHSMGVVDVKIHQGLAQAFTYSRDTVLKVWDLREHTCLQTVIIKIPSSLLGRLPEYGPFTMHLQPPPLNTLLVTANDYIAQLKVGQAGPPVSQTPTSHLTQLCSALYNPHFKQVVTGADDSTVAIWEIDTGAKSMLFTNAHGKEEITCMTFDPSWRRLITGARDGSIKIWNVQNGHNLHQLEAVTEAEVTGIIPLTDRRLTLAVGWNRQIVQYDDSDADVVNVKPVTTWKGGHIHREDILASAYSPSLNILVTASFDAEICVWSLEREMLLMKLRKAPDTPYKYSLFGIVREGSSTSGSTVGTSGSRPPSSRPNSRHRKSHKFLPGTPAPVDKLLFLQSRSRVKRTEGAILVSSEGGVLRWWSIFANRKEIGYYYAPEQADQSVLGLCSSPDDCLLVSGDTRGTVSVWDVTSYCLQPDTHVITSSPALVGRWSAHSSAVVSVEYVEHEHGTFVLTASTDQTARLFSIAGSCVGVFGQKETWSLRDPGSWAETPADYTPPAPPQSDVPQVTFSEDQEEEDDRDTTTPTQHGSAASPDHLADKEDTFLSISRDPSSVEGSAPSKVVKSHSVAPSNPRTRVSLSLPPHTLTTRSQTFHFSADHNSATKSMLGWRVDQHLAQRSTDRQTRRENFGELPVERTSQMGGNLCCPYQVLTTKDLTTIELPTNLPMTSRMQSQGLTATSLTLDNIREMNLSYYADTPPSGEHMKMSRASIKHPGEATVRFPAINGLRKSKTFVGTGSGVTPSRRQTLSAAAVSFS